MKGWEVLIFPSIETYMLQRKKDPFIIILFLSQDTIATLMTTIDGSASPPRRQLLSQETIVFPIYQGSGLEGGVF
jgi:hypothetical protein